MFPDIVLASTPKEILEQGGVSVEIGQRYLLRDSSYTRDWFRKMYESMELYKMKITQDEIQFESLAGDWEDENIYKGRWSMKITDEYIVFQAEKMGEIYEYDKKIFSEYPNFTYNRASLRLSERGQQNLCSRREKFRKRSGIGFAKRIFELL